MTRFSLVCCLLACAAPLAAQTDKPDACPSIPSTTPRTDAQKREAHKVAEQARQAAIVDGSDAARTLFKRAVELDPTEPNTVYALARSYDAAKESQSAIGEYCRFLALTPNAPEASDVKRRITTLAEDMPKSHRDVADNPSPTTSPTPPSSQPVPSADVVTPVVPAPSAATSASNAGVLPSTTRIVNPTPKPPSDYVFALAPFIPGLGQYYTHRPLLGAIVTASSLGALYLGLKQEDKTVTTIPSNPRRQPTITTTKERPNLAAGVTLAMGISMLAELEAYVHGHGPGPQPSPSKNNTVVVVTPESNGVGLGLSVAFR